MHFRFKALSGIIVFCAVSQLCRSLFADCFKVTTSVFIHSWTFNFTLIQVQKILIPFSPQAVQVISQLDFQLMFPHAKPQHGHVVWHVSHTVAFLWNFQFTVPLLFSTKQGCFVYQLNFFWGDVKFKNTLFTYSLLEFAMFALRPLPTQTRKAVTWCAVPEAIL